ncbi:hypothetical protein D3C87_1845470 [compost metagenome]
MRGFHSAGGTIRGKHALPAIAVSRSFGTTRRITLDRAFFGIVVRRPSAPLSQGFELFNVQGLPALSALGIRV